MKNVIVYCFLTISLLSMQLSAFDVSAYTNLLKRASETPWISFGKENFTWNDYPDDVSEKYFTGTDAQKKLKEIATRDALPLLFNLLEQNWGCNKPCLVYYEKIGYHTNYFFEAVFKQIMCQNGLAFGSDPYGFIAFPWLDYKKYDKGFNDCEIQYFWWVYDRKHMPNIWETWYSCWKKENLREKPRKVVINSLAFDISRLGFYIFPYLSRGLRNGDDTLLTVANFFRKGLAYPQVTGDFSTWWDENKANFDLPEAQGFKKAENLIVEKKLPLSKSILENMPNWYAMAESYYESPIKKYWYYFLEDKEDITTDDIQQAVIKSVNNQPAGENL